MKRSHLAPLAALAHHALAQNHFQSDYRTAADCIEFVDITDPVTQTCDSIMREWGLEPQRFLAWNPSVGNPCGPLQNLTSYCILTNGSLADTLMYTTTTVSEDSYYAYTLPLWSMTTDSAGYRIPVSRTDVSLHPWPTRAPVPDPKSWTDMGCFLDTWDDNFDKPADQWRWILEYRNVPREPAETLDKCKRKCWALAFPIAGVKGGDECWCGERNNGTTADAARCDVPCAGDKEVMCGGMNYTSVWEAVGYQKDGASAVSGSAAVSLGTAGATGATGSEATGGSAGPSATARSGAARNAALFGRLW
ncbi:hypothetical protein C7974DRAFT_131007 [Boeremia exigua]|uniref:uncharacterized protein n=1 Tax=Boeremia exigua TaxID=749465 RepID=UPI001E8D6570|nr:uncharacterized protein C7974DRAFT_131007 [Boeremia exigua]KAH6639419.1 hypothetical protein C7974DRAFT_131007 [Boeremia exigua]